MRPRLLAKTLLYGAVAASLPLISGQGGRLPAPPMAAAAPKPLRSLPTPNEAVLAAWQDARRLDPLDLPFTRWLWYPSADRKEAKAVSIALNVVSRAPVLRRPVPVPGNLVRVDLRWYAPQVNDIAEWLKLWEDFQFDPAFSLLITQDELNTLSPRDRRRVLARQKPPAAAVTARSFTRQIGNGLGAHAAIVVRLPAEAVLWIEGDRTGQTGAVRTFETPALPDLSRVYEYTLRAQLTLPSGEVVEVTRKVDVEASYRTEVELVFPTTTRPPAAAASVELVRFDSEAIDPVAFGELQALTGSNAPVVSAPYFLQRVLTTIKDKGVYAQVFGGRYYELAGIRKAKDVKGAEKKTDEDVFLASVGVADVSLKGFNAQQVFDQLRSDQRAAMFHSGVTGKPRRVDLLNARADAEGQNKGAVTHDLRRQDVDVATHPLMNLANFKDAAREAIFPKANGLHLYAIFDGAGNLLDVAAPDVVTDRTIPEPYEPELQCALSCIACHEARGHDGWQPVRNDVLALISRRKQKDALPVDVFTDLADRNALLADTLDRLAGQYRGEFGRQLTRGRDDYALAVLRAAGPWPDSEAQVQVVKTSMTYVVERTRGYQYARVDARQALAELGLDVPKEEVSLPDGKKMDRAVFLLNLVLPPDPDSRVGIIFPEDPRLGALKQGIAIPRTDWALVYGFAARRSRTAIEKLRKEPRQ